MRAGSSEPRWSSPSSIAPDGATSEETMRGRTVTVTGSEGAPGSSSAGVPPQHSSAGSEGATTDDPWVDSDRTTESGTARGSEGGSSETGEAETSTGPREGSESETADDLLAEGEARRKRR